MSAVRAAWSLAALALVGCARPEPERVTACGGRLAIADRVIFATCPHGLASFTLDGAARWGAGEVAGGWAIPVDGPELFYTGAFGGELGVFAAAKATGVARLLAPIAAGVSPLGVAVAGDQVYWIDQATAPTAWTLHRVARAGGPVTTIATSATPLSTLGADAGAVYWLVRDAADASGLVVRRLDVATDAITDLAHLDGAGRAVPLLLEPTGLVVEVDALDGGFDAYRLTAPDFTPRRLAADLRGTLAAGGGYLMAGTIRLDPDGASTRILPARPGDLAWVAIADDDVYFTDDLALWRRPLAGAASTPSPSFEPGPPLVGLPP